MFYMNNNLRVNWMISKVTVAILECAIWGLGKLRRNVCAQNIITNNENQVCCDNGIIFRMH